MSYADAPKDVRALLDHTGLEPIVESTGAKLAVARHVVVAGDLDSADLYQIALYGDLAVDEVDQLDGRTFGGRMLILAPATEQDFRAWGGSGYTDDWGVTKVASWKSGPTWVTLHLDAPGLTTATLQDDRDALRHVIAHELFHALTLETGFRAPLWLIEGFAEVAGQEVLAIGPRVVPKQVALPADGQVRGNPRGYFLAWEFVAFLNHRVGHPRAMRFYLAAVSPHRQATMKALSDRYLGATLPSLVRRWKKAYRAHGPLGR